MRLTKHAIERLNGRLAPFVTEAEVVNAVEAAKCRLPKGMSHLIVKTFPHVRFDDPTTAQGYVQGDCVVAVVDTMSDVIVTVMVRNSWNKSRQGYPTIR